ncbi:MAG: SIR2 family protein, partial [Planctomycetota bacterium]
MTERTDRRGEPEEWTTKAFLHHFRKIDGQMKGRKFAFVLGAGASVTSGVPSGAALVDRWLGELYSRDTVVKKPPIDEWATADKLDIEDFEYDRRAEFYPQIYDRRFQDDRKEGYADLENVMKNAQPGLGYSMLAQILVHTRHKVVITTNFDNLVSDAVLHFTNTFAQTCGHESLTDYVGVEPHRPLIAKIHRDL